MVMCIPRPIPTVEIMHVCTKKYLFLFQESFSAATIFLQLRHFLLDVFQEVRVGSIKSKLPYMASTRKSKPTSQQAKYERNRKPFAVFL